MNKTDKIYVAGHRGMVGSAITRLLKKSGYKNLITATSKELDLRDQKAVSFFFDKHSPDYVFLAAAKVGGIHANNTYKADFIYDNLLIQTNVIHNAYLKGVKKLLFLGSSCIYPKKSPQPIKEEYLLSDYLEETNKPYAIAKIAGINLCESYREQYGCDFISAMPTNLYGPNDNYDLKNSHVLPALLSKFHSAKIEGKKAVEVWGSGKPQREFLHVNDLAQACLFLMDHYSDPRPINVGYGDDVSIADLASIINRVTEANATIQYNTSMPDGTMKKLMDSSRINALGWKASISLEQGIKQVYEQYKQRLV